MIYAVIVVMWAAFLVPMWLRRHDELAEAKSVDKFASKMRVLARRTGEADGEPGDLHRTAPATSSLGSSSTVSSRAASAGSTRTVSSTVRIVGRPPPAQRDSTPATADVPTRLPVRAQAPATRRPATIPAGRRRDLRDGWADDADDAALAALAAPDLARDLARDRGFGHAPASLVARRRRVLAVLIATSLVLAAIAALSALPWILAGASGAAAVAYVLHLRVQAKRTGEIARSRTHAARTWPVAPATPSSASAMLAGPDLAPAQQDRDHDGWQPVSVPVPTYVTAPRAGRAIRRIDLHGEDAWTSGRLVADAAAAGRAAAAAAHQESLAAHEADDASVQRAVGD